MASSNKLILGVLPLACACAASPAAGPAQHFAQYETKLLIDAGQRRGDSAFGPVDEQTAFGLEAVIHQPNARSALEIGLFHSSDSTTKSEPGSGRVDFKGSMTEFSVGGRWLNDKWYLNTQPYAAAGASLLLPKYSEDPEVGSSKSDSGWAIGPYLRAGVEWSLTDNLSIALDYRLVILANIIHDVSFGRSPADANYQQIGIVLGWQF